MYRSIIVFSLAYFAFNAPLRAQCSSGEVEIQIEVHTDAYGYEGYWELVSADSSCGQSTILSGGNSTVGCNGGGLQNQPSGGYGNNQTYTSNAVCLTEGAAFKIIYVDDWGDGGFDFHVSANGYLIGSYTSTGALAVFGFDASEPPAYDITMLEPNIEPYQSQGSIDIKTEILNSGTATLTELTLNYRVDGGSTVSSIISGLSIENNGTQDLVHMTPWVPTSNGEYEIQMWCTNLNGSNPDANPSDDNAYATINIGPPRPNVIDSYLTTLPLVVEIANGGNSVNMPTDLDFHPTLTKKELWILNKDFETTGSSTVTIENAGDSNQTSLWRRDGNAWHFMSLSTGIAFSTNGNFATSPGVFDANHNGGSPFTGPTLWSSDPEIYAQPSGGNGSHLDMLHESPQCQGIASDKDNVFWVFDGYNKDIVRYDFAKDHGPGNADHDDGEVVRYSEVNVKKDPSSKVVSHIVLDDDSEFLYVVDYGNQRVIRINTTTGSLGGIPSFGPYETLAQYRQMSGYDWEEVVTSGLDEPAGIDVIGDRMLVSDYATGEVIIFDISEIPAVEIRRLALGAEGIMGIKIGPEGKIWYVDYDAETVNRVDWVPDSTVGIMHVEKDQLFNIYPNPSARESVTIRNGHEVPLSISVNNISGQQILTTTVSPFDSKRVELLSTGLYFVQYEWNNKIYNYKLLIN